MSKNDITGDRLVSKPPTDVYRDRFDAVFKSKDKPKKEDKECKRNT